MSVSGEHIEWLSVDTEAVLGSVGVQKTLEMEFDGIETEYIEAMLDFELGDLAELLGHFHFPCEGTEALNSYLGSVSCAAYDDDLRPRAVLLASDAGDELLVNFLFGFSDKKPEYILAVCQAFVRRVRDLCLEQSYRRITMLSVNRSVILLLKRVLDRSVEITKYSEAEKTSAVYQKNTYEKKTWMEHTSKEK